MLKLLTSGHASGGAGRTTQRGQLHEEGHGCTYESKTTAKAFSADRLRVILKQASPRTSIGDRSGFVDQPSPRPIDGPRVARAHRGRQGIGFRPALSDALTRRIKIAIQTTRPRNLRTARYQRIRSRSRTRCVNERNVGNEQHGGRCDDEQMKRIIAATVSSWSTHFARQNVSS